MGYRLPADPTRRILRGDCLDLLPSLPDHSIQLVLCDPPYGTTDNTWDKVLPFARLWPEFWRVLAPGGVVLIFAQQPFATDVAASGRPWLKYQWVWEKSNPTGFLRARLAPMKAHELVLVFAQGAQRYHPQMTEGKPYGPRRTCRHSTNYGKVKDYESPANTGTRFPRDVVHYTSERGLHPTQKPSSLVEMLIRTYTQEGDTVLDPCAGSGTTAEAAEKSQRGYVLMESNPEYCQIARRRVRRIRLERMRQVNVSASAPRPRRSGSRIRR